jgi:hypothetical protein
MRRINTKDNPSTRDVVLDMDRTEAENASESRVDANMPMKLIPWEDIWTSLRVARIRGNGDMIDVFYDTLFKEAVFDDHGAWSLDLKKGH